MRKVIHGSGAWRIISHVTFLSAGAAAGETFLDFEWKRRCHPPLRDGEPRQMTEVRVDFRPEAG